MACGQIGVKIRILGPNDVIQLGMLQYLTLSAPASQLQWQQKISWDFPGAVGFIRSQVDVYFKCLTLAGATWHCSQDRAWSSSYQTVSPRVSPHTLLQTHFAWPVNFILLIVGSNLKNSLISLLFRKPDLSIMRSVSLGCVIVSLIRADLEPQWVIIYYLTMTRNFHKASTLLSFPQLNHSIWNIFIKSHPTF